jgi:hypothetical protein
MDAVAQLLTYQNPDTLTFWWQSANAYTAIIQFDILRGHISRVETNLIGLIPLGNPKQANPVGLCNIQNDDTLWWSSTHTRLITTPDIKTKPSVS